MSSPYQVRAWRARNWSMPSPEFIKRGRLLANSKGTEVWIETGTYLGETTEFLSKTGCSVISIEPHEGLYLSAKKKFLNSTNVEIVNGTSEDHLSRILGEIPDGKKVSFWLDGHFSGDHTFLGDAVCPVMNELSAIDEHRSRLDIITVHIDDVRLFNPESPTGSGYPRLIELAMWAENRSLIWWIENDIFVIKPGNYPLELGGLV